MLAEDSREEPPDSTEAITGSCERQRLIQADLVQRLQDKSWISDLVGNRFESDSDNGLKHNSSSENGENDSLAEELCWSRTFSRETASCSPETDERYNGYDDIGDRGEEERRSGVASEISGNGGIWVIFLTCYRIVKSEKLHRRLTEDE